MRIAVRSRPFSPRIAEFITIASAKPSTSSTATVTTVMSSVTPSPRQKTPSVRITP